MNKKNIIIAVSAVVVVAVAGYFLGCCGKKKASGAPVVAFYGAPTCPYCIKAKAFLDKVEASGGYNEVQIVRYDVSTKEGMDKYMEVKAKCEISSPGVPLAVFKDTKPCIYELGFGEEAVSGEKYRQHIVALIEESKR